MTDRSRPTVSDSASPRFEPAPWFALGFVSLLISAIPIGGPPPRWILLPAVLLAVATLIVARTRNTDRWSRVAIWPVAVLAATASISITTSALPGLAIERMAPMAVYLLLVPIVQILCWSPIAIRTLGGVAIATLIALDASTIADVAVKWSTEDAHWQYNRITGPFGNPNDLAVSALLLPIAALAFSDRHRIAGTFVVSLLAVPSWFASLSRQAFLGWIVAVVALLRPSPRRRRTWAIAAAGMAIATVTIALNPMARSRVVETIEGRDGGRSMLYVYGASLAMDRPLTGIGPTLFGEYYAKDALDGWRWRDTPLQKRGMPWVHSLPLEILVETGIVGVTAFGIVMVGAVRRLRHDQDRSPDHRHLAWAASSGLVVIFVVGLVDLSFIKSWCHIVVWTTVGLAYAVPPRCAPVPKTSIKG